MNFPLKEETYQIIGICMEVHNNLGPGFLEIVYKDALEVEFNNELIEYEREKEYAVNYKGLTLPHRFYADFVVFDKIILEVKGKTSFANEDIAMAISYLKVSGNKNSFICKFWRIKVEL